MICAFSTANYHFKLSNIAVLSNIKVSCDKHTFGAYYTFLK